MRTPSLLIVVLSALAPVASAERVLRTELLLDAPPAQVFDLWASEEGVKSFFAPGAHIEPRVDGAYEIFFDPSQPPGHRGADGLRILQYEPGRRLAFTWNAPEDQPEARAQRTFVVLDFAPEAGGRTRFRFTQSGWGEGPHWDKAYAYFDKAWNTFVLPRLKARVAQGPLDWKRAYDLKPVAATLQVELSARP